MSELKTLNDLQTEQLIKKYSKNGKLKQSYYTLVVEYPDLKSEAIKWVKEIKEEWEKLNILKVTLEGKEAYDYTTARAKIEWIKHFFNISEEDLK